MTACLPKYVHSYFLEFVSSHAAKGDEEAQRIMARVKPAKHVRKPPLPDRKAAKKMTRDEIESAGKLAARQRAEFGGGPRCEWFTDGIRCHGYGSDCDHVLGGSHKKEMEDLPNGEGFQVECRLHHDLKHGPGKSGHLAQAKEHAIRIGSRGLRRAVEKATALHEGKHGKGEV